MDLDEVVQKLLESGCRQDEREYGISLRHGPTAIFEALRRRKIQCAQILLENCDANNPHNFRSCSNKIFTMFIEDVFENNVMHDLDEMLDQGIELFLDAGADINQLLRLSLAPNGSEIACSTPLWSVLDYLFCIHPRLFDKFAPNWSPSEASEPTRAGILASLKFGRNNLAEHCNRLAQNVGWRWVYAFLELLVAEQFKGYCRGPEEPRKGVVDLETVHTLVDVGASMGRVLNRNPHLLRQACMGREIDVEVIRHLLDNGAIVDDWTLRSAVRWENTDALELLIQKITNFPRQGELAFVEAATANNFATVKILLDAEVDINAEFQYTSLRDAESLLFEIIVNWRSSFEDLKNMIDFLVQQGAHFRLSAMEPRLSDLMEKALRSSLALGCMYERHEGALTALVHYIIDKGCVLSDTKAPSAMLLDACGSLGACCDPERMEIFEFLFKNGAPLRPGAPLAAWIGIGGEAELVKEMLRGDVDINAYYHLNHTRGSSRTALQAAAGRCSEELVALLLQKGADVNSPARGGRGRTALQAVCEYGPRSPAEKAQQMSIINLLLAHAAKVNAAPARRWGLTALQAAAAMGNLEIAMLLLSCDPPADVNMPRCENLGRGDEYKIALDLAAGAGRLDTVKLLLNNNAVSGYPGVTGYDGAIEAAEKAGHLAVADLIREHAATVLRSNTWHKSLSRLQRDWRECEYDDYFDGCSNFSEYSDEDEDEDEDDIDEVDDAEFSKSRDEEEDTVPQVQIQPEVVEQPGLEQMGPEPGFVWDMEVDESLVFDTGFDSLAGNMGSIYGLDYTPSTSNIDTAAAGWGLGQ